MVRSIHLATLSVLLLAALALPKAASADPKEWFVGRYIDVQCAQVFCGVIKSNPDVFLTSVNPDPLPTVEPGESQYVTITWSAEQGLKTNFELCITSAPGAQPADTDGCVGLQGNQITLITTRYVHFEEEVELPDRLRQPSAAFYVRSTQSIFRFGGTPESKVSNSRGFTWPHPLPNLSIEHADTDYFASSGRTFANAEVTNASDLPVASAEVAMTMFVCDGNLPPSLRPGSTKPNDILCFEQAGNYLMQIDLGRTTLSNLVPRRSQIAEIEVTSRLPASPDNLMVTLVAIVDPDNLIQESNESPESNMDDGTDYVLR